MELKKVQDRPDCFATPDGLLVLSADVVAFLNELDFAELLKIRQNKLPCHCEWVHEKLSCGKDVWVTVLPVRPNFRLFVLDHLPVF